MILLHSVLSLLSFLHPLIPNAWMSSSVSSTNLFLGLPLILLPVGFHSNTLLGILFSSIHITSPNQAILLLFMNLTMCISYELVQFVVHSISPGSIFVLYYVLWSQNISRYDPKTCQERLRKGTGYLKRDIRCSDLYSKCALRKSFFCALIWMQT